MQEITKKELFMLIIALIMGLLTMFGTDLHLASLPYIMKTFHTDQDHAQMSVAIFLVGVGLSVFIYGPLSDKYGRKSMVVIGLFIAAIACFLSSMAQDIDTFLFMRFLQGVGFGVGGSMGRSIFADILHGESLAIIGSYFSAAISISPIFAPVIGGYIQQFYGWRVTFIMLGSFSLILALVFLFWSYETNRHKNSHLSLKMVFNNVIYLLRCKTFILAGLITGICMAVIMIYAATSAFIFQQEFLLSPVMYGWVAMISGIGILCGKVTGPFVIRRISILGTIKAGLIFVLLSGILMFGFQLSGFESITVIIVGVFIAYIGQGFVFPCTSALALGQFDDKRGVASAIYGGFQMLIAAVGTNVVSVLPYKGSHLLSGSYVVLGILGLVTYKYLPKPQQ